MGFTTTMRKHNRSGLSSDSNSDESIKPSTPKEDFTDADAEGSSGGRKRRQCKRSQCKRVRTQRVQR